MAINFPDSPNVNDEFTSGDSTWIYDGTKWLIKAVNTPDNFIICTSSTRPGSPYSGLQIFETDTNTLYVYAGSSWHRITADNTSGTVLKVHVKEALNTYNQFHYSTKTRLSSYDFSLTAAGTNSRFVAFHHNWAGSRTNGVGGEIWYQVNGGGFSCLGSNRAYPRFGCWNSGSTDLWASATWVQSGIITANAGDTINFTIYVISAHAGGNYQAGSLDAFGHPDSDYVWTIFEVVP